MTGISSCLAISWIAGSDTQPSCFWASHSMGITADCLRAAGYLAFHQSALVWLSAEKAKLAGWSLARRRTLIGRHSSGEIHADDLVALEGVDGGDLERRVAVAAV